MQDKTADTEALLRKLETGGEKEVKAEQLRQKLAALVNDLIVHDFDKLVQILYRLDIDEAKLKKTLKERPGQDAGEMIAAMIIERQLQKIKSRQEFRRRDNDIDEAEKW